MAEIQIIGLSRDIKYDSRINNAVSITKTRMQISFVAWILTPLVKIISEDKDEQMCLGDAVKLYAITGNNSKLFLF